MDKRHIGVIRPIVTLLLFMVLFIVANYSEKLKLVNTLNRVTDSFVNRGEPPFECVVKKHVIGLNGHVDEDMYVCLRSSLDSFPKDAKIIIVLNSPGGFTHIQRKIVELINVDERVKTIVCVKCYSAAAFIFQLAKVKRFMFQDSELMFHKVYFLKSLVPKLTKRELDMIKDENIVMSILISQRLGISKELYIKKTKGDWYISPKEAIKYNMVDKIITR